MKRLMLIALFAALLSAAVFADSVSTTLPVTATLLPTVSVSTTNLDFGTWVLTDGYKSATATVTVQATAATNYAITMDYGLHYYNTWRHVQNGAYGVIYEITDPSSTHEWSDVGYANTYPFGSPVSSTGTGSAQTFTANGTLFVPTADPASPIGTYTDFVTVSVNY
jgi:spore coat protein U-like protein